MDYRIPGSLKVEHEHLYEELKKAARVQGKVGMAADKAFRFLQPHIRKEEEFALPELDVLPSLAEKNMNEQELSGVIKLCDRLKQDMPAMLEEHRRIMECMQELNDVATREQKPEYAHLAKAFMHHIEVEEQILYPAALLVGEYVRLKLYGSPMRAAH